ncbi:MAG TPA: Calx-beta domain-containing protein [Pyrinomonadaceae bacterium]
MCVRASLLRVLCPVLLLLAGSVPVFAQTPRKIAFSYGNSAFASHIAVINEDGTGQTILTDGNDDRDPSWSPDGSQIVFSGSRVGGVNIIRMNANGTGQVLLTNTVSPVLNMQPAWSPDGTKIAFTSSRAGARRSEIWVMNADGTNPVRLTVNVQLGEDLSGPFYGLDLGPTWSPDGTKIAFSSRRNGSANPEIYVMNADGSNQTRLTNNSFEDDDPKWTRSGDRITFNSGRNDLSFGAVPIFVQFITSSYRGLEGLSTTILVERSGSILNTSTIQYSATSGTAEAGKDFVAVSGTLTFNPNESTKSFQIPLIYDKLVEQPETVTLTLTNPTGGLVRGRQTAELVINDPPPVFALEQFTGLAIAVNAETFVRDPFPLTTPSLVDPAQTMPTRVALFASFVDLLPEENFSAVTVIGFNATQATFNLPVEFVGKVPGVDDLTQINVVLPNNLPSGELFLKIQLHGNESGLAKIRIQ